jgi:hypothetical protein
MFADMPLDNRTVDKFRGHRRQNLAFSLGRPKHRNDLMFRGDGQFCNIEPKICQYG